MTGALPFRKMHGLGNDFVVIDARKNPVALAPGMIARLGDRRCGVGFDQLVVLEPPQHQSAAVFMRIFNPDGSEAGACGNATRCVASLLLGDKSDLSAIRIQTHAGLLEAFRDVSMGGVVVDMGAPSLDWQSIPVSEAVDTLEVALSVGDLSRPSLVSMGNPHAVFFVSRLDDVPLAVLGPRIESYPLFPDRTNVEIVEVCSRDHLKMRVWERGAGLTPACGSGACAVLVAAVRRGLADRRARVVCDGGELTIEWRESDGHVLMGGPVASVYTGLLDEAFTR
ncbi:MULTISPECIES: diaminopimelate epimerase [unclassified Haematospirillum]|uniref:diaminopimelate epimerase n=1 Tax=unclassified Haematospirillum TaxID=2622088 RepID=UPI001439FD77|nr:MULTISPECIES: diaminopimelate epimerase [unclassified Haematospirillum]NKD55592.1 diaminopimelate epimerase [Haematospirillum sp. H4890]NKD75731.1 diaminopimelate epimerase [Haematospirillum sp. H4485]